MNPHRHFARLRACGAFATLTIVLSLAGRSASAQDEARYGSEAYPMPGMRQAVLRHSWSKVRWELPVVMKWRHNRIEVNPDSGVISCYYASRRPLERVLDADERALLRTVIYEAEPKRGSIIRTGGHELDSASLETALLLLRLRTIAAAEPQEPAPRTGGKRRRKAGGGQAAPQTAEAKAEAKRPYRTAISSYGVLEVKLKSAVRYFWLNHGGERSPLYVPRSALNLALYRLRGRTVRVVGYRRDQSHSAKIFVTGIPLERSETSATWVHPDKQPEGFAILPLEIRNDGRGDTLRWIKMDAYYPPAAEVWPAKKRRTGTSGGLSGALGKTEE